MNDVSIYTNNPVPKNQTPQDRIARLAMEVRTIDDLLVMGYTSSNGVNLRDRRRYLETQIAILKPAHKSQ